MTLILANLATSTLAAGITDTATSITVATDDGALFPAPTGDEWFPLVLTGAIGELEVVHASARAADTITVTRGAEGTTAQAFSAGARVDLRLTAAALATKANLTKPWSLQPIGVPIAVFDNLAGVAAPPTDEGYRYIKLTAADAYNTGFLTSESVSGSAPNVIATAVVDDAGSPLNGVSINLLNTERRFVRPGETAGTTEEDQNAQHNHTGSADSAGSHAHSGTALSAGNHRHSMSFNMRSNLSGGSSQTAWYGGAGNSDLTDYDGPHTHTLSIDANGDHGHTLSVDNDGGNEARPRNIWATYYLRIK